MRDKLITVVLIALIAQLFICSQCLALDLTLEWDYDGPSSDTFTLYYGQASRKYTDKIETGTNKTGKVTGLISGAVYYFAATAKDPYGNESDYSEELVVDTSNMFTFW